MSHIRAYIEIEKGSNQKYEWCSKTNTLVLDRVLPHPYYYPFAYGFFPNTKAMDGDELDMLLLTEKPIAKDTFHDVYVVGVLIMEDEKGMDEKLLCVLEEDSQRIRDITDVDSTTKETIHSFFTHYKSSTPGKWSRVIGYEGKEYALQLYSLSLRTQ